MSIEERFDALRKYMDIYIDLLPYTFNTIGTYANKDGKEHKLHSLRKSDLPTFKDYLEPDPKGKGWKDWQAAPPMQRTMIIRRGNIVINTYCGGVFDPDSNDTSWLYYYRYDTWHGCRFNVTPKVFNPKVKINEK